MARKQIARLNEREGERGTAWRNRSAKQPAKKAQTARINVQIGARYVGQGQTGPAAQDRAGHARSTARETSRGTDDRDHGQCPAARAQSHVPRGRCADRCVIVCHRPITSARHAAIWAMSSSRIPRRREQAKAGGHPVEAEVQLLVVHGVLHLLGHDHYTEAEKNVMWKAQAATLKKTRRGVDRTQTLTRFEPLAVDVRLRCALDASGRSSSKKSNAMKRLLQFIRLRREGIGYALRTQANLRIHLATTGW